MKLNIPEQTATSKDDFPNHPRKIKKWLAELPKTNMGEYTRNVYKGIMQLNRQSMPGKRRLQNMELIREPVQQIFSQLHKHFVNRSLPLPEKSLKIITLNQAILNEMAIGYKIVIFEDANKINKVGSKHLLLAGERALHYMGQILLRASQVYSFLPKGLWWDIHHVYTHAETKKLHLKKIKDPELAQKTITIENYYKQLLLFSLSHPNALRQNDAERVHKALATWIKHTRLTAKPSASKLNRYFCSQLDSDAPPNAVSEEDMAKLSNFRVLELAPLVDYLGKQISGKELDQEVSIGDDLSQETIKTLVASWSMWAKRRFSRAVKQSEIKASIGLSSIYKALTEQHSRPTPKGPKKPSSVFSLGAISDNARADIDSKGSDNPEFLITHPNMKVSETSGLQAWDMVSKGAGAMTDGYVEELKRSDEEMGKLNKEAPDLHWKITNVSAGGYCLHWDSTSASRAQVGELIGIRERTSDNSYHWRIGIIRWMHYTRDRGLEIGVQVVAPTAVACTLRRLERKEEIPFECLLLPEIKPLQQPSTVMAPAYAFKKGNILNMHVDNRDMEINLGTIREHTGSFSQFQFSLAGDDNVEDSGSGESRSSSSEDFDSIWSSI